MKRLLLTALLLAAPLAASGACFALDTNRFTRFEENFALYNQMQNNGWAEHDENALRGHYSFAFTLCESQRYRTYFSYTGEFDFYMRTRDSDPVINRLSNPALHWRWCADCRASTSRDAYLDVAIEHRSNGQVGDVTTPQGVARARAAYDAKDRQFFDAISRGSNYLSLTNYSVPPIQGERSFIRARLKLYLTKDSQVTWGPLANSNVNISDYDRGNLLYRYELPAIFDTKSMVEAEWTVGDKGFKTDSLTLGWHLSANNVIPFYVRAHFGPMNTLSNYTERQNSIGIGVRFDADYESTKVR